MVVAYVPHAFDMFNVEHVDLIRSAAMCSDRVVLGVLTDQEILVRSGREPVVPLAERLEIVRHVRGVDDVLVHDPALVPDGARVMVAAGEALRWQGAEVLPQGRISTSDALRRALRGPADEALG